MEMMTTRAGVNGGTGLGLDYPIITAAPFEARLGVVGVNQDRIWSAISVPDSANNQGWISDEYVDVENGEDVPIISPPPTPTPAIPPTPTATPAPDINFSASRTTINAGEKATLSWLVEDVVAVYMYPVGDGFKNYPVTGQGSRDVQPYITTTYELLALKSDDTTSAERIEITVVNGLASSRWILQTYGAAGRDLKSTLRGTEITARFGTDGILSGSGGCNNYNGEFMAFDQTLRINSLSSTQVLCATPEDVMDQEGTFFSLMKQVYKMAISAGQLEVFDSNGNRILVFING